jgi:hypothetical protein
MLVFSRWASTFYVTVSEIAWSLWWVGVWIYNRVTGVRFPTEPRDVFVLTASRRALGAHPASNLINFLWSFRGIKRTGHQAYHSPPSGSRTENSWSFAFTHPFIFMAWCVIVLRTRFLPCSVYGGEWSASSPSHFLRGSFGGEEWMWW